jgi:dTDP-4-amino-4,6-dideoxygalactose transaminase
VRPGNGDVWHLYVVRVEQRERVMAELGEAGIGASIHYPTPVPFTEAYACLGYRRGQFPVAEAAAERILSLPMFPHLTHEQQERVVDRLRMAAVRND